MTKQEILDYFSLIDFAYNESGRLESLSRMIDELLKEQPQIVRCKDCKFWYKDECSHLCAINGDLRPANWFCADGEKEDG